jgi:hypothetical protein
MVSQESVGPADSHHDPGIRQPRQPALARRTISWSPGHPASRSAARRPTSPTCSPSTKACPMWRRPSWPRSSDCACTAATSTAASCEATLSRDAPISTSSPYSWQLRPTRIDIAPTAWSEPWSNGSRCCSAPGLVSPTSRRSAPRPSATAGRSSPGAGSVHLGRDLRPSLPRTKPSAAVAAGFHADTHAVLARARETLGTSIDPEVIRRVCRMASKKMVQVAFAVVMARESVWATVLEEQAAAVGVAFPQVGGGRAARRRAGAAARGRCRCRPGAAGQLRPLGGGRTRPSGFGGERPRRSSTELTGVCPALAATCLGEAPAAIHSATAVCRRSWMRRPARLAPA